MSALAAKISVARPRILVVDDVPANLVAMRSLLSRVEADVVTVDNGNAALAACFNHRFAVVLMDVQMPGMDGFEVAELLASEPRTAAIPVIFLSAAYVDDLDRLKGYRTGAVDYIAKPVNDVILVAKVQVFLDLYRRGEELRQMVAILDEANLKLREQVIERERAEERARYLALHDPLTGLANRTMLIEHLWAAMDRARRRNCALALVYIDIDDFKPINDKYGHHVGDLVLIEIAQRLCAQVRSEDLVVRLGGDEFAVVMEDLYDVGSFVQRMAEQFVESLRASYWLGDGIPGGMLEAEVSASVGIAIYPKNAHDSDSLLQVADRAMYSAKQAGRNRYHWAETREPSDDLRIG